MSTRCLADAIDTLPFMNYLHKQSSWYVLTWEILRICCKLLVHTFWPQNNQRPVWRCEQCWCRDVVHLRGRMSHRTKLIWDGPTCLIFHFLCFLCSTFSSSGNLLSGSILNFFPCCTIMSSSNLHHPWHAGSCLIVFSMGFRSFPFLSVSLM